MSAPAAVDTDISTTSSSHTGNVYETDKAVAEYLQFHFGRAEDILPYPEGPHSALEFAQRTGRMCIKWARAAGLPLDAAFDVGCAVGGTAYELSTEFTSVHALDYSHAFIAAANKLKAEGSASYTCTLEGEITEKHTVHVPATAKPERVTFFQGDACALPTDLPKFTVIHAANLMCRLPDPMLFLERLPGMLVDGGLVVFISPYSWLKQYTPKEKWVGGKYGEDGCPQRSAEVFTGIMNGLGFELMHEEQVPFLIREHVRKFQWGCSHGTVWRKKATA